MMHIPRSNPVYCSPQYSVHYSLLSVAHFVLQITSISTPVHWFISVHCSWSILHSSKRSNTQSTGTLHFPWSTTVHGLVYCPLWYIVHSPVHSPLLSMVLSWCSLQSTLIHSSPRASPLYSTPLKRHTEAYFTDSPLFKIVSLERETHAIRRACNH